MGLSDFSYSNDSLSVQVFALLKRMSWSVWFLLLAGALCLGGCGPSGPTRYTDYYTDDGYYIPPEPTINYTFFDGNWYRQIDGCYGRKVEACKGTLEEVEAYVSSKKVPVIIRKLPPETTTLQTSIRSRKGYKIRYKTLLEKHELTWIKFYSGAISNDPTRYGQCSGGGPEGWRPYSDLFERGEGRCYRSLKPLFFDQYIFNAGPGGWDLWVAPNPKTGEYVDSQYPAFRIRMNGGSSAPRRDGVAPGSEERKRIVEKGILKRVKFYEAYIKSMFIGPELPAHVQAVIDERCSFKKKNGYRCVIEEGI